MEKAFIESRQRMRDENTFVVAKFFYDNRDILTTYDDCHLATGVDRNRIIAIRRNLYDSYGYQFEKVGHIKIKWRLVQISLESSPWRRRSQARQKARRAERRKKETMTKPELTDAQKALNAIFT